MRGFQVWLADGSSLEFEASSYEVDESGGLSVWGGSEEIETFAPGAWVEVRAFGRPLSDEWPYPRIELLMANVYDLLIGKYGGWVHGLDEERLSDWRLNDFDELLDAILEAASLDPTASEDRSRVQEVRRLISEEFDIRLPADRRRR